MGKYLSTLANCLVVISLIFYWKALPSNTITQVAGLSLATTATRMPVANPDQRGNPANYGKMALSFTANQGQTDPQVVFMVSGSDRTIYFTATGVTFVLSQAATSTDPAGHTPRVPSGRFQTAAGHAPVERWALKLDFVGARQVRPQGLEQTDTLVSYFKGKPQDWHAAIPTYARIVYPDLWPGVDLTYSGTSDHLKYAFTLHPGADLAQIRLVYRSASAVRLDESGRMLVSTPLGDLQDEAPTACQEIGGQRIPVAIGYDLQDLSFGFTLGSYDPAYPLVIDPAVLVYSGFIGGSSIDEGMSIAVDRFGAAYITGYTMSTDFPVLGGPDLTHNGGDWDVFVAKVKPDGSGLDYAGFLGGSSTDFGSGIAVDGNGAAYLTGSTSSDDFPLLGGPDLSYNGNEDAFVVKVKADGSELIYAGYLGGGYGDEGTGIAVDNDGAAYVTGNTSSAGFPVQDGPNLTYNGGEDAFVTKVKSDGSGLVYSGFLGGSDLDHGQGIAVDSNGAAYITGYTRSPVFPALVGPDPSYNGDDDAFVTKVKSDGSELVYSGYLGGTNTDRGYSIAVDSDGAAYIAGYTASPDFPVLGGPDLTIDGSTDAFAVKIKPDGSERIYAGFIGGSGNDWGYGIAVDSKRAAYVTGGTYSTNFPTVNGPDLTFNGNGDVFVAKLAPDASSLTYAGYLGGSASDSGWGIAVDNSGAAYVAGSTNSANFPVSGGPDLTFNGGWDAFVAKITPFAPPENRKMFLPIIFETKSESR